MATMGQRTYDGDAVEKDVGAIDRRQHEVAVRILPHGRRRPRALQGDHHSREIQPNVVNGAREFRILHCSPGWRGEGKSGSKGDGAEVVVAAPAR